MVQVVVERQVVLLRLGTVVGVQLVRREYRKNIS